MIATEPPRVRSGALSAVAVAAAVAATPWACKRDGTPPPTLLQDGSAVAALDAAPAAAPIDAAPAEAPPTAVKVVVGAHAACAVMSDRTARCWGANAAGQLGDGTQHDSAAPVAPKLRGVLDLALGDDLACALLDDASVACWGKIAFGAKAGPTLVPTGVPGAHDMVRVFAVGGAGCSSSTDGALVCWGDVDARGHVTHTGAHRTPTPVPGVDHVAVLGDRAAVRDDGDASLWLDGGAPVRAGLTSATELATRVGAACVLDGGDVRCFGPDAPCAQPAAPPKARIIPTKHNRGHGPRKLPPPPAPAPPPAPPALAFGPPALHLAFDAGTCVVTAAKQVVCLGETCKPTRPWPQLTGVVEIAGTCARLATGTVRCGPRGGGGAAPAIAGVTGATQIAVSGDRGCAVVAGGDVACWSGTGAATPVVHR